jgi:hypothetical protein
MRIIPNYAHIKIPTGNTEAKHTPTQRTAIHSTIEKPTHQQNLPQTHNICIQQNNYGMIFWK